MCIFSGPSLPSVPAPAPAPPLPRIVPPIEADLEARRAGDEERRRRAAASGRSDTILTGGSGLRDQARTGGKALLGQ